MRKKLQNNSGFTLIEVLLVVALISITAGFSGVLYTDYQTRNELDLTAQKIAQGIRTAQINSQTMKDDSTWGIYMTDGEVTLFEGVDYATRNTNLDYTQTVSNRVSHSGIGEIVFSKYYGVPSTTGTIDLTTPNNGAVQITINEKGIVDY